MLLALRRLSYVSLCFVALGPAAAAERPTPEEITATLRTSVPTIRRSSAAHDWRHFFAGHFSGAIEIAKPPVPSLSGDELYLFPDTSYIYIEWTDILAETICDKGSWEYDGRYLRLHTDHSLPQKYVRRDAAFLPLVARVSRREHLFMTGVPREYTYFREHAKGSDEFMFLLCAHVRKAALPERLVAATKQRLMRNSWRPDLLSR